MVGQGYGLTETTVGIAGPDRDTGTVPGSVGRLLPNTELRVVDGELWLRGPQIMRGYLGRPNETAGHRRDGWLHTGDVVRADEAGTSTSSTASRSSSSTRPSRSRRPSSRRCWSRTRASSTPPCVGRPTRRRRGPGGVRGRRRWTATADGVGRRARGAPQARAPGQHVDAIPRTPAGKVLRRRLREPVSLERAEAAVQAARRACLPGSGESSSTTPRRTRPRRALATRQRPAASV